MIELLERVERIYTSVDGGDKSDLEDAFQRWLTYYGATWPNCVDALSSRLATDMK